MVMSATPVPPRPINEADTLLGLKVKHWVKEAQARTPQQGRTTVVELLHCNAYVPVSYNNAEAISTASELQALTMDPEEVAVRPEVARVKLATCARMVRWRTAVARLYQGRLDGGSD